MYIHVCSDCFRSAQLLSYVRILYDWHNGCSSDLQRDEACSIVDELYFIHLILLFNYFVLMICKSVIIITMTVVLFFYEMHTVLRLYKKFWRIKNKNKKHKKKKTHKTTKKTPKQLHILNRIKCSIQNLNSSYEHGLKNYEW